MTFRNAFRLREEIFSCMGVLISCAIYGASMEHLCMGRIVYMCVWGGGGGDSNLGCHELYLQ